MVIVLVFIRVCVYERYPFGVLFNFSTVSEARIS
jgi:hypothetical protein